MIQDDIACHDWNEKGASRRRRVSSGVWFKVDGQASVGSETPPLEHGRRARSPTWEDPMLVRVRGTRRRRPEGVAVLILHGVVYWVAVLRALRRTRSGQVCRCADSGRVCSSFRARSGSPICNQYSALRTGMASRNGRPVSVSWSRPRSSCSGGGGDGLRWRMTSAMNAVHRVLRAERMAVLIFIWEQFESVGGTIAVRPSEKSGVCS